MLIPRSGRPRKTIKEQDDRVVELLEDSSVGSRRESRETAEEKEAVSVMI